MVTSAPILRPVFGPSVMPFSSLMSFMFIKRFGAMTSSFIRANRSVPPASTSLSPQDGDRRPTACLSVVGLAYSNARMVASFLFERFQHSIRRQRQVRHPDADRVCHGVRDSCAGRHGRRLAQTDDPSLVITFA